MSANKNNQPDFFSDVESLSPKLKWLRKHGLTTTFDAMWEEDVNKWSCYPVNMPDDVTAIKHGLGDTEDAAIISYCEKHGLTHYTLEESQ